jgi:hypothetical protein
MMNKQLLLPLFLFFTLTPVFAQGFPSYSSDEILVFGEPVTRPSRSPFGDDEDEGFLPDPDPEDFGSGDPGGDAVPVGNGLVWMTLLATGYVGILWCGKKKEK